MGFPGGGSSWNLPAMQEMLKRCRLDPQVGKIPQSRKWQPAPVFLPGKFHGQRSLMGYRPWGHRVRHDWATQQQEGFSEPLQIALRQMGFPDSSVGKESACNARDPISIPGSERSPGEGVGYPLQCSCTSLMAQLVKNPPAMRETWVRSLGWEDPLEKGKVTHSSILAWSIPWTV